MASCVVCGAASLKGCGGCRAVAYCSVQHQTEHWHTNHAFQCRVAVATPEVGPLFGRGKPQFEFADGVEQACFNTMAGAMVGDAMGGILEYSQHLPGQPHPLTFRLDPKLLDRALKLKSGGYHGLAPGQYTDDSEMAVCLARAMIRSGHNIHQLHDDVLRMYVAWTQTHPFDIGGTTKTPLLYMKANQPSDFANVQPESWTWPAAPAAGLAAECYKHTNAASSANGGMMRTYMWAIWAWKLSLSDERRGADYKRKLAVLIWNECALTHPNPEVCAASALFGVALAERIQGYNDEHVAMRVDVALAIWLSEVVAMRDSTRKAISTVMTWAKLPLEPIVPSPTTVRSVWEAGAFVAYDPTTGTGEGYVMYAYKMAMGFALQFRRDQGHNPPKEAANTWLEYEAKVLQLVGDADTNAGIVGAALGPLFGVPEKLVDRVRTFDPRKAVSATNTASKLRPDWLLGRHMDELCRRLLDVAPANLDHVAEPVKGALYEPLMPRA